MFKTKTAIDTPWLKDALTGLEFKRSVGRREVCVCGGAEQGSLLNLSLPSCTARNNLLFQEVAIPPQACHSRCSVTHQRVIKSIE
ncbi:MAG: hypothetical protein P8179_13765 [Candidatus Thiodiazotropha sp.]